MNLLDAEMVFVTGKGGAGKTTVAAALALSAARDGRRTIVCELHGQARIPPLLGHDVAPDRSPGAEVELEAGLFHTSIEPWHVMEEWIGGILRSRALTGLLTRSNFFRSFADAAPGGMELGAIVKAWELTQQRRWDRRRRPYDVVIVDGPASGHAIGMLQTPGTFADIARVGPIASQSARTRTWLRDERRTAYLAVASPTEMSVSETLDLAGRLEAQLDRRLAAIVVNEVLPDRFGDGDSARIEAAAGHDDLATAVASADARADAQAEHLARLRAAAEAAGTELIELPYLFEPHLTRKSVEFLTNRLAVA